MKKVYIIGGTMGVGKTTVCEALKFKLCNSVFLDGDWCWNSSPFQVNDETKHMVLENICFLLNQFINCSAYQNVIFCWVMDKQFIIDNILKGIDKSNCEIKVISLICDSDTLKERIQKDIIKGIRKKNVLTESTQRIPFYNKLNTIKIDTNCKTVNEIADEILSI